MREGERPGPQSQVCLGTLDLLLLEELVWVQGLVEEAALHRRRLRLERRGGGGGRGWQNCWEGVRDG